MLKHQWKFIVVLIVGIIGAISAFGFNQPIVAEVLIDIIGIYTAITMAIEMIGDIRKGRWGVDILAIIAIVSINTYELVKPGDKIAVCISGGKDSMLMAK